MRNLKDEILRRESFDQPLLPNTETLRIDPETASWVLSERMAPNRKLNPTTIRNMVSDIIAGSFLHNGQTIVFGRKRGLFYLLTGQHRLHAIVKANMPIVSEVNFSAPFNSQSTMDIGKSQSGADKLGQKYLDLTNAQDCWTVSKYLWWFWRGFELYSWYTLHSVQSNNKISQVFDESPDEIAHAVSLGKSVAACSGIGMATQLACIYLHLNQMGKRDLADSFFDQIRTGTNLDQNNPAFQLREFIRQVKASRSLTTMVTREGKIKALTLAVNAAIRGNTMSSMRRALSDCHRHNELRRENKTLSSFTEEPRIIRTAEQMATAQKLYLASREDS